MAKRVEIYDLVRQLLDLRRLLLLPFIKFLEVSLDLL